MIRWLKNWILSKLADSVDPTLAKPRELKSPDPNKASGALTREMLEKGFQNMRKRSEVRDRYYAEGGKPFLMPTPEMYRLAREIDYDLEGSYNIIRPIGLSDLEETPLDDDTIEEKE